ncbi:MAG: DoxX family protein [Ferruginibacter sp.]
MKNFFSSKSPATYNTALLALRLGMGALMTYHGYEKIINFNDEENGSMNFIGLGSTISQILVMVVELGGGILVLVGLGTRLAASVVSAWLLFILARSFDFDVAGSGEKIALLLIGFITLAIGGAGKYSLDNTIENKLSNK